MNQLVKIGKLTMMDAAIFANLSEEDFEDQYIDFLFELDYQKEGIHYCKGFEDLLRENFKIGYKEGELEVINESVYRKLISIPRAAKLVYMSIDNFKKQYSAYLKKFSLS